MPSEFQNTSSVPKRLRTTVLYTNLLDNNNNSTDDEDYYNRVRTQDLSTVNIRGGFLSGGLFVLQSQSSVTDIL